jgi:hypothetical protein
MSDSKRHTFAIPEGAGDYAPVDLVLNEGGGDRPVYDCSVLVEALPATATVEVWLLRVGGDFDTEAHWINSGVDYDAVGLQSLLQLGAWAGVKLRGKSGGTDGDATISVSWD